MQGRVALSFMQWAAVPWTGGRWAPQQGQAAGEAAPATEAAAAPAGQPPPAADSGSLDADLEELAALSEGLDAAIEGLSTLLGEPASGSSKGAAPDSLPAGRRRALRQAPLGPEALASTSAFLRGPDLAGSTTAASEEECAAACSGDERCTMWALCPLSEADGYAAADVHACLRLRSRLGSARPVVEPSSPAAALPPLCLCRCETIEFCESSGTAGTTMLPSGTCLLTFDASHSAAAVDAVGSSRTAYTLVAGAGVAWSAGALSAVAGSPGAAPSSPGQDAAAPSPAPAPSTSPSPAVIDVSSPPAGPPAEPTPPPADPADTPSSDGGCPEPGKSCGGLCINVQSDRMK